MNPATLKKLRLPAAAGIMIGIAVLIADFVGSRPVELRYVLGAIALIGFSATVLYTGLQARE
jgi:hypothetical protein